MQQSCLPSLCVRQSQHSAREEFSAAITGPGIFPLELNQTARKKKTKHSNAFPYCKPEGEQGNASEEDLHA